MAFLQTKRADFFTLSHTSAIEIPTLKLEKKVPISDGASPYRLLEGVSPGVPKEHGRLQSSGDFIEVKLFNT